MKKYKVWALDQYFLVDANNEQEALEIAAKMRGLKSLRHVMLAE